MAVHAAALIAFLVVLQLHAMSRQWALGYRPFGEPPERVPYSWDMFAVRITRCSLRWDEPIAIRGRSVRGLEDLAPPIEWGPVLDTAKQYARAGERLVCRRPGAAGRARIRLACFGPGFDTTREAYVCPAP